MQWKAISGSACPVAQTAAVIGDRWTLLILREAFFGVRTFSGFEAQLKLSPHVLSSRLKRLLAAGVVSHQVDGGYHLTDAGRALHPIILTMADWGAQQQASDERGSRVEHRKCGQAFRPVTCCSECGEAVGPSQIRTIFAPALAHERGRPSTKEDTHGGTGFRG